MLADIYMPTGNDALQPSLSAQYQQQQRQQQEPEQDGERISSKGDIGRDSASIPSTPIGTSIGTSIGSPMHASPHSSPQSSPQASTNVSMNLSLQQRLGQDTSSLMPLPQSLLATTASKPTKIMHNKSSTLSSMTSSSASSTTSSSSSSSLSPPLISRRTDIEGRDNDDNHDNHDDDGSIDTTSLSVSPLSIFPTQHITTASLLQHRVGAHRSQLDDPVGDPKDKPLMMDAIQTKSGSPHAAKDIHVDAAAAAVSTSSFVSRDSNVPRDDKNGNSKQPNAKSFLAPVMSGGSTASDTFGSQPSAAQQQQRHPQQQSQRSKHFHLCQTVSTSYDEEDFLYSDDSGSFSDAYFQPRQSNEFKAGAMPTSLATTPSASSSQDTSSFEYSSPPTHPSIAHQPLLQSARSDAPSLRAMSAEHSSSERSTTMYYDCMQPYQYQQQQRYHPQQHMLPMHFNQHNGMYYGQLPGMFFHHHYVAYHNQGQPQTQHYQYQQQQPQQHEQHEQHRHGYQQSMSYATFLPNTNSNDDHDNDNDDDNDDDSMKALASDHNSLRNTRTGKRNRHKQKQRRRRSQRDGLFLDSHEGFTPQQNANCNDPLFAFIFLLQLIFVFSLAVQYDWNDEDTFRMTTPSDMDAGNTFPNSFTIDGRNVVNVLWSSGLYTIAISYLTVGFFIIVGPSVLIVILIATILVLAFMACASLHLWDSATRADANVILPQVCTGVTCIALIAVIMYTIRNWEATRAMSNAVVATEEVAEQDDSKQNQQLKQEDGGNAEALPNKAATSSTTQPATIQRTESTIITATAVPYFDAAIHILRSSANIILLGTATIAVALCYYCTWSIALIGYVDSEVLTTTNIFLLCVSFYWTNMVIQNIIRVTISNIIIDEFFDATQAAQHQGSQDGYQHRCRCCAIGPALGQSLTRKLGSICFGGLLSPPVETALMIWDAFTFPACKERQPLSFLRQFNEWAYYNVGIYGCSFLEGGRMAVDQHVSHILSTDTTILRIRTILYMASFLIAVTSGCFAIVVEEMDGYTFTSFGKPIATSFGIGFVAGILLSQVLILGVVGSIVSSMYVGHVLWYAQQMEQSSFPNGDGLDLGVNDIEDKSNNDGREPVSETSRLV